MGKNFLEPKVCRTKNVDPSLGLAFCMHSAVRAHVANRTCIYLKAIANGGCIRSIIGSLSLVRGMHSDRFGFFLRFNIKRS